MNADRYRTTLQDQNGERRLIIEELLRDDFIRRAVVFTLDEESRAESIFFNSSDLGTVYWDPENGLHDCRSWETEDHAREGTFLQRHYPIILHNGVQNDMYAHRIVSDVVEGFQNPALQDIISRMDLGDPIQLDLNRFPIGARGPASG
ncbi:MAG: hypothetical protein KDK30_00395 [Leptospiraceae bacterium]|nr:hypothetical protein [Leptospiraceae bacterium]MCB1316039.1 hypothetical protein [Leptospiraceae bacterium]MCB1319446.1 hypothetical protein [Leptospiraceae bacterium]